MNNTPLFTRLLLAVLLSIPAVSHARGPGCGGGHGPEGGGEGCRGNSPQRKRGDNKPPKGPGCGGLHGECGLAAAQAAVQAAADKAADNLKETQIAPDFGPNLIQLAYGDEKLDPAEKSLDKLVKAKSDYWKPVLKALVEAREKATKELEKDEDVSSNEHLDKIKALGKLTGSIALARLIVDDIDADAKLLKDTAGNTPVPGADTGQGLIKRKVELFAELAKHADPDRNKGAKAATGAQGVPALPATMIHEAVGGRY